MDLDRESLRGLRAERSIGNFSDDVAAVDEVIVCTNMPQEQETGKKKSICGLKYADAAAARGET